MQNKGQMNIGAIMGVFIIAIVGLVLFVTVAQDVGVSTSTITLGADATVLAATVPDAISTKIDLVGQDLLSTPTITNGTGGQAVAAGNWTIGEHVSTSTGVKSIYFQLDDPQFTGANLTANGADFLNISYTYGPDGYINSAGGRSVASLIVIFFAIAIAFVALEPTLRSRVLESMGR